ncbi:GNAT family N-acetyltransferase [Flavihumibacter fluvii]|uniref:GNAT family N-acetyltransferase n=1 Tax=Flavihumibacter fluvii TaxID=2838157 RepID=UPI001BDDDEBA|nr:GNAT family N-acetyltransferase [Flavihumibacter fluvii]ULQ54672.1 GNAT family N-acetyltransferase [Flavihumibacter fluvii]
METTNFNCQPTHLADDLIWLAPLQAGDFEQLYAVGSDPLIWAGHPQLDRYKKEKFQVYFDEAVKGKNALLVFDKASNELIGSSRFYAFQPEISRVAIGYTFLAHKYWGGRYNLAMKTLMLNHAFTTVESVVFHIGATNIRSQKAVEKIGANKISSEGFIFNNSPIPYFEYEIRKAKWISPT